MENSVDFSRKVGEPIVLSSEKGDCLAQLPLSPGVYYFMDASQRLLYVGKAKELRRRVGSYFQTPSPHWLKQAATLSFVITQSEAEALCLEYNYIQLYRPKYNIKLRDDRVYPTIYLSEERYPALRVSLSKNKPKGKHFGPFAHRSMARSLLQLLKRLFPVRQCSLSKFSRRSRPCLDYYMGYCLGPCVSGYTTQESYDEQVHAVEHFLTGSTASQWLKRWVEAMERASKALDFEKAIKFRNNIRLLQGVLGANSEQPMRDKMDVLAVAQGSGLAVLYLLETQAGQVENHQCFEFEVPLASTDEALLEAFIATYYLNGDFFVGGEEGNRALGEKSGRFPYSLLLSKPLEKEALLKEAGETSGRRLPRLRSPFGMKGVTKKRSESYLAMAEENAKNKLEKLIKQKEEGIFFEGFMALEDQLGLEAVARIDGVDISHLQGEATVGSVVSFERSGAAYALNRSYPLALERPGSDVEAISKTVFKAYSSRKQEHWPQILVVDGGMPQLEAAKEALQLVLSEQREISSPSPYLIALEKGKLRLSGWEKLSTEAQEIPSLNEKAFNLLLTVRDASHRLAGAAHQKIRSKALHAPPLLQIDGVGKIRAKKILQYCGGLSGLKGASIEQIAQAPGISKKSAKTIWDFLHKH